VEDQRDWQSRLREEARHVHEGMYFGVEGLWVDGGDGLRVLPGDAEVCARRGVGREREHLPRVATEPRDVLRQALARRGAEGVRGDLRRVVHRTTLAKLRGGLKCCVNREP